MRLMWKNSPSLILELFSGPKKKGIFLHDLFLYVATSSVNILMEMSEER